MRHRLAHLPEAGFQIGIGYGTRGSPFLEKTLWRFDCRSVFSMLSQG
jgi:hypothetical protein